MANLRKCARNVRDRVTNVETIKHFVTKQCQTNQLYVPPSPLVLRRSIVESTLLYKYGFTIPTFYVYAIAKLE